MEKSISTNKKEATKPLSTILQLLILTIFFSIISYTVTENPFQFTNSLRTYILYIIISLIISYLLLTNLEISFSGYKIHSFILYLPQILLYVSIIFLIIQRPTKFHDINFWFCLILLIIAYIFSIYYHDSIDKLELWVDELIEKETIRIKIQNKLDLLSILTASWSISMVFITLGTTIFSYSVSPMRRIQSIHSLLDFRISLAIIILIFIAFRSMVKVLRTKSIDIKQLLNIEEKKKK